MSVRLCGPCGAALAFALVGAVSPLMGMANETATCDAGQLQDVVGKGMAAISRRDEGYTLSAGATLNEAGQICEDVGNKVTGFLYGDYFLAYGFYFSHRRSDAQKYVKDGLSICHILDGRDEYLELAGKMRIRFEELQAKLK